MKDLKQKTQEIKDKWDVYFETAERPCCCIFCQFSKIYWNGNRIRSANVQIEEEVVYIPEVKCKRVKCADCKKSWTLRPPGLMPNRHYQLCVVADAASNFLFDADATKTKVAETHDCSIRTIWRWIKWIASVTEYSTIVGHIFDVTKEAILPSLFDVTDIVRKAKNTGKQILKKAAKNLCLLEALSLANGYEPPGLRAVIEKVIMNRDRISTYDDPFIPDFASRLS